jgi:hypothetical protein
VATIIYTLSNSSGCSGSTTLPVTVNGGAGQPGNFTSSSSSVRLGQSNVLFAVPYVSGVTYKWSYSGRGVTIHGSSNSVKVNFSYRATPGTLSVTATNSCGTSIPRSIDINLMKDGVITEGSDPESIDVIGQKNELIVYPNPTPGPATFEFSISENAKVILDIYSIAGQRITRLFNANVEAGSIHTVVFNQRLSPGVYPCIMMWEGHKISTKLNIVK